MKYALIVFLAVIIGSYNSTFYGQTNTKPIEGKLIKIGAEGSPCAYGYLIILNGQGKEMTLFLDGNLDKYKVGSKKIFKYSDKKIFAKLDSIAYGEEIPDNYIEQSLINKSYIFYCYKQQLNCGDDPNSPKEYFCKTIIAR